MSVRTRAQRCAVWGAALVILSGPIGSGGRDADVLMAHQTLVTALALVVAWSSPTATNLTGRFAWILAAVVAHGILITDYKYAAGLALMDWISAAMLFGVVAGSCEAVSVGPILGAVIGAASLNSLVLLARGGTGMGFRGLFANPHHGATLMASAAAMLLVSTLHKSGGARVTRALPAAGLALLIVVMGSRGGALALVASCGVGLVLSGRSRWVWGLVGFLVLMLTIPSPLSRRVWAGATGDIYAFERVGIWLSAVRVARQEFLLGGAGLGQFEPAARRYNFPVAGALARFGKIPNHAHNELLHLIAEAGVAGLLAGLAPLAWAVARMRDLSRSRDPSTRNARVAAAGLAGVLAHSMVEFSLQSPAVLYATAGLFGVLAVRPRGESEAPTGTRPGERVVATTALLAAFFAWALFPWLGDRALRDFRTGGHRAPLVKALRFVPGHAGYHRAIGAELGSEYLVSAKPLLLADTLFELSEAIRLAPADSRLWATRARFQHHVFRDRLPAPELADAALRDFREASRREPRNPFLLIERASLLGLLGRNDEAHALAMEAVALEPNYVSGWRTLAGLCRTAAVGCDGRFEVELARLAEWAPRQSPGTDYERALLTSDAEAQP